MAAKGWRILQIGLVSTIKDGSLWHVRSGSSKRTYTVLRSGETWTCTCPALSNASGCKHVAACQILVGVAPKEPAILPEKKAYNQKWAAYDLGQTHELPLVRKLLGELAATLTEPVRQPGEGGRPPIPLGDQLFASVMKVWGGKSGRRSAAFLADAVRDGYLHKDFSRMVIQRFLGREDMTPFLSNLVTLSALPLAGLEEGEAVAPDSTGVQSTLFGAWRETMHGEQRDRHWLKVHAMVGTRTHIIIRAVIGEENSGDSPQFAPLLRWTLEAGFHPGSVVADKGYLSKENYRIASELGIAAYIPFKSNSVARNQNNPSPSAWRKAYHLFQANRPEFDRKFHRRSNVESVFGALKKKFGEDVKSRTKVAQVNEILCKIIAYNLAVLVHEMFENGIAPLFTRMDAPPDG